MENALDDIINEAIISDAKTPPVTLDLNDLDVDDNFKQILTEEFEKVIDLLDFNKKAYEIFKIWYVDGRIFYHTVIDEKKPELGILSLRQVNALYLRKVREVLTEPDPDGFQTVQVINEYYLYQEGGFKNIANAPVNFAALAVNQTQVIRIAKDAIVYVTSGLQDHSSSMILSYLHSAIKPLNQLRMLEDAAIIYRLVRAPSRRVFKIDVGGLPRGKAEQYVHEMMVKHKNRVAYDASTGEIRDERKFMTMLEDYWFPSQNGRGTEVDILPGGENLGQMDDVQYFKENLYTALKIPMTRLDPSQGFSLGRPSEITRDELKFGKFISRLQLQFSQLFSKLLRTQLVLTRIVSPEEWEQIEQKIAYRFAEDSFFQELKDSEVLRDRAGTMATVAPFVGDYLSRMWVWKNVWQFNDEQIDQMLSEIQADGAWLQAKQESEVGGMQESTNPKPWSEQEIDTYMRSLPTAIGPK